MPASGFSTSTARPARNAHLGERGVAGDGGRDDDAVHLRIGQRLLERGSAGQAGIAGGGPLDERARRVDGNDAWAPRIVTMLRSTLLPQ